MFVIQNKPSWLPANGFCDNQVNIRKLQKLSLSGRCFLVKLFDLSRFRFNKFSEWFSFDNKFRQKIWKRLINPMVFLFLSEADCTQMYLFPTSKATVYHLTGKQAYTIDNTTLPHTK